MRRLRILLSVAAVHVLATAFAGAQDQRYLPSVAPASNEPELARQSIRRPNDIDVSLFAAEPRLANPVVFTTDEKGRFYVVETFRLKAGVTDNRSHMDWLDADLAARTVEDRVAMMKSRLGKEIADWAVEHDRIRLIEDRDGDGKADRDQVFADGFKDIATGLASGVLAYKGDVYYTCIPDLWKLRDTDGDGKADVRTVLSTGYGVHVSFIGHDSHGLIVGPDGRLYFSIGDRGLHVVNREGKTLDAPDTGSVLRCDLDGSNLEIFATGLRNPQELAFDNEGNLFTVDNNSDSGDKARAVYLVEGGDGGWRIGYQYLEQPVSRGPWNAEKLWHPAPENKAAYLLPPLMNLSDGPSGLTFDPGVTLLPDRYKNHFFLADFRGSSGQSGIRSFAVKSKGASFEIVDSTQFLWSVLATDVDFAPDGALYVSDWVEGWDKTGKGRIWRFEDPKKKGDKAVKEVQRLLGEGMSGRDLATLTTLMGHPDRRIRQAAQFELVDRTKREHTRKKESPSSDHVLIGLALSGPSTTVRLHAIWGLGQIFRSHPGSAERPLAALITDENIEIRAQYARFLENASREHGIAVATAMLDDGSPRVRFFAAQTVGKLGDSSSVAKLLRLVEENADKDLYVRHAAVVALARIGDVAKLAAVSSHPSTSVRLAALLALRRLERPEASRFLDDADPKIVLEAARAIYDDAPKPGPAMEALAALASHSKLDEPTLRRVVNADARLGGKGRAEALVGLALNDATPQPIRIESLELLGDWAKPSGRDRLTGLWRPYVARPRAEAVGALRGKLDELLEPKSESIRRAAIKAIGELRIDDAAPRLATIVKDADASAFTRIEALKALEKIDDPSLSDAVVAAVESSSELLRSEGRRLLAKTQPAKAIPLLAKALKSGTIRERQNAYAVLGDLGRPEADALLVAGLNAADVLAEAELDLLDAGEKRVASPEIKAALAARTATVKKDDPLAGYRSVLLGGNAAKGRAIFEKNTAVYCLRCHKIRREGGEVGPDLSDVGKKQNREYIAAAIIHPNAAIAQGFETVVVALNDGKVISGVFKSEDDKTLRLMSIDNKPIEIAKSDIDERKRGPSAMPEDVAKKLKKSEIRDLVEFLATRR